MIEEVKVTELKCVPLDADHIQPDVFYIWALTDGDHRLVWLNSSHDGIVSFDSYKGFDCWYFDHGLSGQLFGPVTMAGNPVVVSETYHS